MSQVACTANGLYHIALLDHKAYCDTQKKAHKATAHNLHRYTPKCETCSGQRQAELGHKGRSWQGR